MEKEILNLADASELLSLPEPEVAQLLAAGELPGRLIGPHWYVSRQRLLQFIAETDTPQKVTKPPPAERPGPLPSRVLGPNWRCEKCEYVNGPDIVECSECGAIRNTPMLGFRLPRPGPDLGSGVRRKVN